MRSACSRRHGKSGASKAKGGKVLHSARPWWLRLLLSLAAGLGSAVLVAIVLAIVDLYLSGHGFQPLNVPLVDWSAAGIHLSVADVIFLGAAALAAAVTWRLTATDGASPP